MTTARIGAAAAAAVLAAALGFGSAAPAQADNWKPFGTKETLKAAAGKSVADFKVIELAPSTDPIPYQTKGRLFLAIVTMSTQKGSIAPRTDWFVARAADGTTYPALAVDTPQGLTSRSVPAGKSAAGRIYFDVTGELPDHVIYTNGKTELLAWAGPPKATTAPPPAV